MQIYHKIETLYEFDLKNRKFKTGVFFNKTVEMLKDYCWIFTEKVDGTNFRLGWNGYNLSYAGRTDDSKFSQDQIEFIESNIATKEIEQMLEHIFKEKSVIIFGELHGGNINNGYGYSQTYSFKVFDAIIGDRYITREEIEALCQNLELDIVPIVFRGTIDEAITYVKENDKSTFSEAKLEGLVGVPKGNLLDSYGKRIIVKIKKRDL